MKVRLIKIGKIGLPDLLFLIVFISFYISRYHFSQVFRSLFRIIHKKDFCHEFSFLTDSLKPPPPPPPPPSPPLHLNSQNPLSFFLLMFPNLDFIIQILVMKHPNKWAIFLKCDSTRGFLFSNVKNFEILAKAVSFLLALKEISQTCLSNLNSLSIVTPKSFTSTFFYILFPTIIFILKININNININKDLTLIRVIFPKQIMKVSIKKLKEFNTMLLLKLQLPIKEHLSVNYITN